MTRKWRQFEILISQLQKMLAPEGAEIHSPERFYYEDGQQKAEVDITLRLNNGSSSLLIGFECRLRPSDGRQGPDWIENIAGRRDLINAHHMVAISGTGFTEPAKRAAEKLGIGLRVIDNIENVNIKGWFGTTSFHFTQLHWKPNGEAQIKTIPDSLRGSISAKDLVFDVNSSSISFEELIWREVEKIHSVEPILIPDNTPTNIVLDFGEIKEEFIVNEMVFKINKFTFPIITWREVITPQLLISRYIDPHAPNMIKLIGSCDVHASDRSFKVLIIGTENTLKPESKRIRGQLLTLDNKPYDATGMHVRIIGYKEEVIDN
jgi:hypothetical protein